MEDRMSNLPMDSAVAREAAPPRNRVEWIDVAKGICIFLVVMLHTNYYVEEDHGYRHGWLSHVVDFAKPFRMPDFFLLSGLLLGRVINRPWRSYLDTKVVHFLYFFVLWEAILFAFFNVRASWKNDWSNADLLPGLFLRDVFVESSFPLWFIHSLPIYFLVTRLIRTWSPILVIGILLVLHSFTMIHYGEMHQKSFVLQQFCVRYIYFYSGFLFAPLVFRMAEWACAHRAGAIGYLLLWSFINQWAVAPQEFAELPLISVALGYAGAFAVIVFACLVSQLSLFSWLHYLGKNSIVVYLSFMIPMVAINRAASSLIADIGTVALITTAGSILASVLFFRLSQGTPLEFLYRRPEWAKVASTSATRKSASNVTTE